MMLSVLLAATAAPVRAGNIHFGDVVQTIVDVQSGRSRVQLSLRAVSQSGKVPVASGTTASVAGAAQSGRQQTGSQGDAQQPQQPAGSAQPAAGTVEAAPAQTGTSGQVQAVDLGDVTGTVCDCGEIPLPAIKSGLPLWPLLGALPLICVTGVCTGGGEKTPECIVNCGPTTTIPEPATLLLFGSGLMALGAGVRRRRARRNEEVEAAPIAQG